MPSIYCRRTPNRRSCARSARGLTFVRGQSFFSSAERHDDELIAN
jgi:hypothetical protein